MPFHTLHDFFSPFSCFNDTTVKHNTPFTYRVVLHSKYMYHSLTLHVYIIYCSRNQYLEMKRKQMNNKTMKQVKNLRSIIILSVSWWEQQAMIEMSVYLRKKKKDGGYQYMVSYKQASRATAQTTCIQNFTTTLHGLSLTFKWMK